MLEFEPYREEWESKFYELNMAWLSESFLIELYDEYVLKNPREAILDKGGDIFFGIIDREVVATFALVPRHRGVIELNKMTVEKELRGRGLGSEMMSFAVTHCRSKGVEIIELYTNSKLVNAIRLYRKFGFEEAPIPEDCHYDRCDIRMTLLL